MPLHRRQFLATSAAAALLPAATRAQDDSFEVTRSEEEWRAMLTDLQYEVMREEGTEPAFSSPLHDSKAKGIYHCRGCDLAVYSSEHKYDSGTGWPSYWQSLPDAIRTKEDRKLLFIVRTECHCRRCGSHLGHIFDDGPEPTGKRHCLNGVALTFQAA
ncbi:MAG: peptide-methionine (R)-S-oxide reductase MsrB [Marinovum algicola]|jgi:peptide-methionine (R)-S-oxide reductase|uniref:peptide-methionine (R)-S-oxide reductase n=1 Tax=Marinovum algicola TaxID=42444 RepID=A0A975W833_9RHOB|nr:MULTISPECIES: peptide-methionine (R)-S-oxide reductase MsrB [Marinovum]AKO96280.1 methionine-R-sulfoxide reductase [Marinovum algicola DG 898]MDD9738761.1 peptide-methionine (R)-S-oxide reductase MsrB [Marinovum sp. SP66]MDD9743394.1 peptide-methionine (R)-S-oxide reductase MsrB [Marinovum sp. PR37]SEI93162.1 peptide-methionine (R)-S-oxide reductase [Marinovum algicola]SLN11552.1 Peptide methionine sulfoxide reductase MsrB [Marinovum algicola]